MRDMDPLAFDVVDVGADIESVNGDESNYGWRIGTLKAVRPRGGIGETWKGSSVRPLAFGVTDGELFIPWHAVTVIKFAYRSE